MISAFFHQNTSLVCKHVQICASFERCNSHSFILHLSLPIVFTLIEDDMILSLNKLAVTLLAVAALTGITACTKSDNNQSAAESSKVDLTISADKINEIKKNLSVYIDVNKINNIIPLDYPNLYFVDLKGANPLITTGDGKYFFGDQIFKVNNNKDAVNIAQNVQFKLNAEKLSKINLSDFIEYPSTTKEEFVIYVFSDPTCPYCQEFHKYLPEINNLGISVRYIGFPRATEFVPILKKVWCSSDKKAAFASIVDGQMINTEECQTNPIDSFTDLGHEVGVNGTPNIFLPDGRKVGGFMKPTELYKALSEISAAER